ncbi:hypothetical protein UFOVP116_80 [uncultured Caudovirales phage]|uniref:Uncharacterized protein n=1 Tax=uncultured Caudovirales phage TaxID=2100421 RepID=A0A6J5L8C7_9CAUD|nr:hypothetical protein UFOVP116_80 [uncultured Caudovirales phage]
MRLYEFAGQPNPSVESLKTVLSMLVGSGSEDPSEPMVYSTASIINMVRNTGQQFEYADLVKAMEDPAIKAQVANFNQQELTLSTGATSDEHFSGSDAEAGPDKVAAMAKKSLAKHKK